MSHPSTLSQILSVSRGDRPADLVLKNARIIDVLSGKVERADVAVAGRLVARSSGRMGLGFDKGMGLTRGAIAGTTLSFLGLEVIPSLKLTDLGLVDVERMKSCALLRNSARMEKNVQIDYLGFDIPDVWVVGYGLDFRDRDRALPYIRAVPTVPS